MVKLAPLYLGTCLSLVVAAFPQCTATNPLPGTSEGTFSVTGTLGTNTCGSGINPDNPWDFSAFLSEDGSTFYMEDTDGTNEVTGTLSAKKATLSATVTTNADATEAGAGSCDLTEVSSVTLDLSSASSPTSFTGTATYTYSVSSGVSSSNNCTDQLASSGGPYSTLPCSVTYSLSGTNQ
jgi:hypothetical protein